MKALNIYILQYLLFLNLIIVCFSSSSEIENLSKKLIENKVKDQNDFSSLEKSSNSTYSDSNVFIQSFSSSYIYSNRDSNKTKKIKKSKSFSYSNINGEENSKLHGSEFEVNEENGKVRKFAEIYKKNNDKPFEIRKNASSTDEIENQQLKNALSVKKDSEEDLLGPYKAFFGKRDKSKKKTNLRFPEFNFDSIGQFSNKEDGFDDLFNPINDTIETFLQLNDKRR